MLITRKSLLTDVVRTRDLPITDEEMRRWRDGEHAQHVWPNLSPDDREFIMTGISPAEWETLKEDDE